MRSRHSVGIERAADMGYKVEEEEEEEGEGEEAMINRIRD